ncbi:MAG: HAD-IC family P-type ATPase [Candidatus Paceibacterota bacterium]
MTAPSPARSDNAAPTNTRASSWYTKDAQSILAHFTVKEEHGLDHDEVLTRRERYGANTLPDAATDTLLAIFVRQFKSPLIYLLMAAAGTVLALGEYIDGGIIVFILLFNAIVGTIQSYKAQNTLLALKKFAETFATVRRNGDDVVVKDEELVPGDIIILKEGEKVPADARILSAHNLRATESALTGESDPISKHSDAIEGSDLPLGDRRNMVYRGTAIVAGNAVALVVTTGTATEIGRISQKVEKIDMEIPLQANIRRLSHVIVGVVLVLAAGIVLYGTLAGHEFEFMFTLGVSVIVSAVPEGLPIVITLVLATGVWRMSKRNVLVKQLQAVEALGEADAVAVDKTGTITKNELLVQEVYSHGTHYTVDGFGYSPDGEIKRNGTDVIDPADDPYIARAGLLGVLASSATLAYDDEKDVWTIGGDPTEAALTVLAHKAGLPDKKDLLRQHPLLAELPFSSEKKYHSLLYQMDSGEKMQIVVGAPEIVLSHCTQYFDGDEIKDLTAPERSAILETVSTLSGTGYRVLMFAKRSLEKETLEDNDVNFLVYEGLYAMRDALRENVAASVATIENAGVRMMMITGDHKVTAQAIAEAAGIYKPGDGVMEGVEIDTLSEEALAERVANVSVFARVSPDHKLRIIAAFKSRGETIAMTGDGVNDALSLVSANLGVAMGKQGTEVAKEASDLVLMDDDISSIAAAIEEGRAIHQNIKKVTLFLFTTSLGEIVIILTALLAGLPIPITAAQVIWLNFVTDGFLDVALAMEPKEKNLLRRSFPKPSKWIVEKFMLQRMILKAGTMVVGSIGMFVFALSRETLPYAITVAVTTMAAFQWTKIWTCRSDYDSVFRESMAANKYLLGAFILVIALHVSALYTPFLSGLLGFVPIAPYYWLLILPVALSVIVVDEIWKIARRHDDRRKAPDAS